MVSFTTAPGEGESPVFVECEPPACLPRVRLPLTPGNFDVALDGGRIASIAATERDAQWLLLPAFADMHVHAERAYASERPPASFAAAVAQAQQTRARSTEADFAGRAGRLFARALAHGSTRVRTHTDVDDLVGERAIAGVNLAREAFAGRVDVELVAFANARTDPASAEGRGRLLRAVELGAKWLGAVPALAPRPVAALDAVLDIAREAGVSVDLHLDEHGRAEDSLLSRLVEGVAARGLQGRVTVSHACALAALPAHEAAAIAQGLAEARVTVVTLPATNLYLQDRSQVTPRRRGVTLVRELVAAGVPVWFGSDNVRDAFYPYGDADPLEAAFLVSLAAHVDDPATLVAGLSAGRCELAAGDVADLVLVRALSLHDALARRPAERVVLRGGRVVAAPVR